MAPRTADRYSASNSCTELRENGVVADMDPQTDGRTDRRLLHTRRSFFVSYITSEN